MTDQIDWEEVDAEWVMAHLDRIYERLVEIAGDNGCTVELSDRNHWHPAPINKIEIDRNKNLMGKIAALAHEIGHVLTHPKLLKIFGSTVDKKYTSVYLQAEFEAWSEADKLARGNDFFDEGYLHEKRDNLKDYYVGANVEEWRKDKGIDKIDARTILQWCKEQGIKTDEGSN